MLRCEKNEGIMQLFLGQLLNNLQQISLLIGDDCNLHVRESFSVKDKENGMFLLIK